MLALRPVTVSLLAVALALPAAAVAQFGAADEQYRDPLAGQTITEQTITEGSAAQQDLGGAKEQRVADKTPGLTSQPAQGGSNPAPAPAPRSAPPLTAAAQRSDLAKSGAEPWMLALAGLSLLMCGAGLRLRAPGA